MSVYVAFLRGINLGPTKKISMPALREMATGLGYEDVTTYINSGNLIFRTSKAAAAVEKELGKAIEDTFGHSVDVAVRTPKQLEKVVAGNPFPDGDPSHVTVAFLTRAAPATAKERIAAVAKDYEPYEFAGHEVYVHYSKGIGTSKLAEKFSSVIQVSSTVRNIRTVEKVLALCAERES